jgi:hypothetical protein
MDNVFGMSAGRLGASVACLLGLAGVIIVLVRLFGRRGPVVALTAGVLGMAVGGVVVATSDSGIGTGNGRGGAYVALVVGAAAVVLALIRRRTPAAERR